MMQGRGFLVCQHRVAWTGCRVRTYAADAAICLLVSLTVMHCVKAALDMVLTETLEEVLSRATAAQTQSHDLQADCAATSAYMCS
jgi:hypothetical protein